MDSKISLTPPLSPASEFEEQITPYPTDVPYFSCQESSYLKSKLFGQLINLSLHESDKDIAVVFGRHFSYSSALWNNMHSLFADIYKSYCHIRALTIDNLDISLSNDPLSMIQNLRKDICSAFLFLFKCLQTFYYESTSFDSKFLQNSAEVAKKSELLTSLISEVKSLLLSMGRIINMPNVVLVKNFNEKSKIVLYHYHYFHMCLDIWWNSTAILYLTSLFPFDVNKKEVICCDLVELDSFEQVISLIIVDLMCISLKQHEYFNCFFDNSPFKCNCIQELWTMCIIMLDKKPDTTNNSFWTFYNKIITNFYRPTGKLEVVPETTYSFSLIGSEIQSQDLIVFSFWLTSHLSKLYKYNEWGYYEELAVPKSGFVVLKNLVNLIITSNEMKEKTLHEALIYCIQMVSIWEPKCDIVLPLTDYFIKKINDTFLPKSDINSLSYLHSNTLDWYHKIIMFTAAGTSLNGFSSYDLFLKMLSVLLSKSSDGIIWRSLKGRIYSKFIPKKFKEFSDVALQNSFTLFLVIIHAGQEDIINDVTNKMCELITVTETSGNRKKQMISWRAIFVLMYILQKKKLSLSFIISKISKFFIDACLIFRNIHRDTVEKNLIMSLLMIYIDNMSDTFKNCQYLSLNECELVNVDFSILLSSCGVSELNYILNVFIEILKKVESSVITSLENTNKMQYVNFLQYFFANVNPAIEKLFVSDTPPLPTAEISAILINLSYKFSSLDLSKHDYISLFVNFLNRDNVSAGIVCSFLGFILDNDQLVNAFKCNLDFSSITFQSWLKCIVYSTPPCPQMNLLTQKILTEKEILESFSGIQSLNFESDDYVNVSIAFFQVMANHFESLKTLQDKNAMKLKVQQYFKKFVPVIVSRIRKQNDVSTLTYLYKITSHLVEQCSQLLHIRCNPESILPQLLDQTIFPHLLFPKDKNLQTLMLCSIKEYLPSFFRGLMNLNYMDDKCIQREIKNIIVTFVGSYAFEMNPIGCVFTRYAYYKPDVMPFLLDIMKTSVLLNNSTTKNGFLICFQALKNAKSDLQKIICDMMLKCALEIYMKHTGSFSDFLLNFMREVLDYLRWQVTENDIKIFLLPVYEWFIKEKLQWSVARGFAILNDVIEYIPFLFPEIVPCLTKTIVEIEKARGIGKDVLLRDHLQNIIQKHEKIIRQSRS